MQPDLFDMAAGTPAGKPLDVHPFERSGLGVAPFRFIGFWPMPSQSLAEANPSAYNAAMQGRPRVDAGGPGCCGHCGTAIVNHCIISDVRGRRFYVGTDCVEKTDQASLTDPAKKARVERVARQAAYQAKHGDRLAREAAARAEAERKAQARRDRASAILAPFAAAMADGRGGFCDSVANDLRNGAVPFGRGERIALEILGKQAGRYNSKAYWAAHTAAENAFQAARIEIDRQD